MEIYEDKKGNLVVLKNVGTMRTSVGTWTKATTYQVLTITDKEQNKADIHPDRLTVPSNYWRKHFTKYGVSSATPADIKTDNVAAIVKEAAEAIDLQNSKSVTEGHDATVSKPEDCASPVSAGESLEDNDNGFDAAETVEEPADESKPQVYEKCPACGSESELRRNSTGYFCMAYSCNWVERGV